MESPVAEHFSWFAIYAFALNVDQSVVLNKPRFAAEADGMLNVCADPVDDTVKSVPVVATTKNCAVVERPFSKEIPEPATPSERTEVPS
ncbi:MAG: hypothetical protein H7326_07715 [Bdellovibrionaceae bacterium]|nr:hypothetical protein [Pseudobdellovibrionaceae bacterium]